MTQYSGDPQGEPPVYGSPGYPPPGSPPPGYPPTGPPRSGWGQPGGGRAPGPNRGGTSQEQRQWAMLAHLGGVLAIWLVVPLIPALVIFTVYLSKDEYIRDQAREALNFQVVILIASVAAWILDTLPFFPDLHILVWIFSLIFSVIAAVAAGRGQRYRYPLTFRFLS